MRNVLLPIFLLLACLTAHAGQLPLTQPQSEASARLVKSYGQLPLSFERNQGQSDKAVKFISRGQGYTLFLTPTEAVLALRKAEPKPGSKVVPEKQALVAATPSIVPTLQRGNDVGGAPRHVSKTDAAAQSVDLSKSESPNGTRERLERHSHAERGNDNDTSGETLALHMQLIGANPNPTFEGRDELPGKVNYLKGNDPKQWRTGVSTYGKVKLNGVYDGVDLVYYGNGRQLEYDFIVAPGTDPKAIRLNFSGADSARLDAAGDLLLHTKDGELRLQKPVVYQTVGGRRQNVDGCFVLHDAPLEEGQSEGKSQQVGFQVAAYDVAQSLVIDPVLVYSTYLGGSGSDYGNGIAVDNAGNAYISGLTASSVIPLFTADGRLDFFVTKLSADGSTVLYSTYLGGSRVDYEDGIAVDSTGNAYVTGFTQSTDFPIVNAKYPALMGDQDAFVVKFSADGSKLLYSTYLGGSNNGDGGLGIAVDSVGNAYVTGVTNSSDFPTVNAKYTTLWGGGNRDAFVVKFSADGSTVLYSTYLGGSDDDDGNDISVDSAGNAYVTGFTQSTDFPTVKAKYPVWGGDQDAFVVKFSADGSIVLYSTYLGGKGTEIGYGIAVDSSSNAYVTGLTQSSDFPTVNAKYPVLWGGQDAFVVKFSNDGSTVLYSTYLGGSDNDVGNDIAVNSNGNAYVTGEITSNDFPTVNAIYPDLEDAYDAFVTKFNTTGSQVQYSTHLGGSAHDVGLGIAVDSIGNAFVTGSTYSCGFPTNATDPKIISWDANCNSGGDAFVAKIRDNTPPQTATYGGFYLASPSGSAAEPVNTATGNYYYQHSDLSIAGRGLPFAFSRTYNAQDSYSGPLGRGWTHSYNLRLTANNDGSVTIKQGDGHEEFYDHDGNGGYVSRYAGLYSRLLKNGDNSYTLTTKDRIAYSFATDGKLTAIADKNGNTLSFAYDGAGDLTSVTDTAGRMVTLSIDANHRITALTDTLGRKVQFAYDADGQLISDTDALGGIQTYSYDAGHRLMQITDRRGHVLVNNTYDAANRVVTQANGRGFTTTFAYDAPNAGDTTITDALGHATIHAHDDLRRLVKETDPLGHSTQFVYDANNNRTQVTDKNGNITHYAYDARGNVTAKTDALGHLTAIAYDTFDNPTQRTDALNGTTALVYDGNGNLTQNTDALGHVSRITYNAHGQPLTSTDALGRVTTYAYDAQGNLIKSTDALGDETLYNYDVIGRRTGITAANGAVTTFAFDADDRLTSSIDALDGLTLFSYDANGNRTGMTDALGRITAIAYDENDLPVTVTDALGGVTAYSYDAADNRIAETDPRGNTTQFGYDAAKRRTSMTDALGHITTLAYDAQDNLTGITNPLGHVTAFGYDALNRRVSSTDGLGHAAQTAYDALGRVTQGTDANGRKTQYTYDASGRLTQTTDALGGKVDYTYDAVGNRTAMTEPNGNTTVYVYDALNHLIKEADPLGHAYQYAYDAIGNVSQRIDALDHETAYNYDANNRLTAIQYPDASTVSFTYDALGNRTLMTDSAGQTQFSYDVLNRLTQHTGPFGKTVGYAYDAAGNLQALTYPGNKTVTYGYDALNRMQSVTDWLGDMAGYSYDAAGNLVGANNPNGTQAAYSYDNAERLTQLVNRKPGNSVLANYNLTLDAVGNRTAIDKTEPLAGVFAANTSTYDYDTANRVTAENGQPLSHDANGNLMGKGGADFSFDFDNRLTGMGSISYRYDGLGHRMEAKRSLTTTRYVHGFAHALPQVLMETNSAGDPLAYYVYGLGLVSRIAADNSVRYYHYDTLGSTVALTGSSGNVTDRYAYDPFGQVMSMQQSTANPFRYVGQFGVMDDDTGLNYMRARYYSASLGRFISKDPLTGNLADGQSLNRYAYGLNNPVRFVDVSGLSASEGTVFTNHSSSDLAHNKLLQKAKLEAIKAQYEYSAALETEAAYWEAWEHTQEGILGAGKTILDFVVSGGNPVAAFSGILDMSATFEKASGHEKQGIYLDAGGQIAGLLSTAFDIKSQVNSAAAVTDTIRDVGWQGVNWTNLAKTDVTSSVGKVYAKTIEFGVTGFDLTRNLVMRAW